MIPAAPFTKMDYIKPNMDKLFIHYKVWDEINYPFPKFNGCTIEVWEWMSNFIPDFTGHVIIYPCRN